jgi:hypothetical protein
MPEDNQPSNRSSSNNQFGPEWEEFCSITAESGHRFNSRYARRKSTGRNPDPEEILQYLTKLYDRTARVAVKRVTDYQSALRCIEGLNAFLKPMLKLSSKLLSECLPPEKVKTSLATLRLHLLARSEHWKAEAQKRARSLAHRALRPESKPPASRILIAAMGRLGLNAPQLARKIQTSLKGRGLTRLKVDRATVYRIVHGRTKRPNPAIRNALIEELQLQGEDAATVRRGLSGNGSIPACS